MFERNDDVLYICYDNEGYMNTGVQRSSATPPAARTATTMAVGPEPGNVFGQGKFVPAIAMAHEIPYVATATVADLRDLEAKVRRAMEIRGARYIHILVPCPLGWGTASHETIKMARLAKETGMFPVFEAEHGEVTSVLKIRHQLPVEEYLKPQKRYAHLFGKTAAGRGHRPAASDGRPQHPQVRPARTGRRSDGQALCHHPRSRFLAGQPHRFLAHHAPGLRRPSAALQRRPARPARTSRAGCSTPRAATTKRPGAR